MRETISVKQHNAIWQAYHDWCKVIKQEYPEWDEEKYHQYITSMVNLEKSCLMGRMLFEGKEPLPFPPPTAYSAPWYGLFDLGKDYIHRSSIYIGKGSSVNIMGDNRWKIVDTTKDVLILSHERLPEPMRVLLRDITEDELDQVKSKYPVERQSKIIFPDAIVQVINEPVS